MHLRRKFVGRAKPILRRDRHVTVPGKLLEEPAITGLVATSPGAPVNHNDGRIEPRLVPASRTAQIELQLLIASRRIHHVS